MKLFLVLASAMLAATSQVQLNTPEPPDLIVLRFDCGKYENSGHMIRSVQDPGPPMNEPIVINQERRNEPQEVKNRRDMLERRAEMRTTEVNAALSKQPKPTFYFYRLEVKNTSAKAVKSFAWQYQPTDVPDPFDRQFFCVVKAKPNESKQFELFSPLAPSRVVDAAKAGDKPEKGSKEKVIINKIEYVDGSVWKRPGWNPATFSADATQKIETGKCIGL